MIPRTPVVSSQIESLGHDPVNNRLVIEFKSFAKKGAQPKPNSVYQYENFTTQDFQAFNTAESKGKHFGQFIKNNPNFAYRKLTAEEAGQ